MATLGQALTAAAGVPAQVEAKFTFLPPLSKGLKTIASKIPTGPNLFPTMATQTPTLPTLPNIPNIFKGATTTGAPIIPYNPRTQKGLPGGGSVTLMPMGDATFTFK